jgi:multidrug resistance efflux pump
MKFHSKRILTALTAAAVLLSPCALADTITFNGTVAAGETYEVYAPIGGTVARVNVEAGQKVGADDVIVSLSTAKVYAEESGVVTGIFGQPGDNAETVANKYGAVMYIEGESVYSIAASTDNAYNSTATKFVHVGEDVCLSCYSDGKHTGTGVITAIEGTDYTVRVTSGEFLVGETVNVYRGEKAISTKRIGRGKLSRTNPTAVTGTGSIVSFAVAEGDSVQRGDLLFETLDGSFNGLYMSGSDITAGVEGTISRIDAQQGSAIQKDSVVAALYPEGSMRIEAQIEEANLASIAVGDPVSIELLWNQDEDVTYEGTITMISAIADSKESSGDAMNSETEASDAVTYTVYVDFTPDENTRYGMSAVITTLDAAYAEAGQEAEGGEEVSEDAQD